MSEDTAPGPAAEPLPKLRDLPTPKRRSIWPRLIFIGLTAVALYILWPSLLTVFEAWPELLTINPVWFVVMFAFEVASFVSIWALQRLAVRTDRWFGVATAQLAGNAVSRIVPGGAAAGGAIQYKMLTDAGTPATQVATGLTAAGLIATGTLFALPVLTVPAVLLGRPTPSGLAQAAWLGGAVFVIGFIVGWILLTRDGALRSVARAIQWIVDRVRRKRPRTSDLPERLLVERNAIRQTLGSRWWQALLFALGNWLFDYLALLAAITATGSHPRPTLVLLAYGGAMVLGMIPITPGGLGFVEAGLTGLLALAGVNGPALATLAYRLVSYWLPLPAGVVAAWLHRRRYTGRETTAHAAG
jgi:uncharacterized protein (TIRG00374 family)